MKRLIFAIILFIIFMGAVIWGIKRGDFSEVRNNGSVICLSCIGIE